MTAPSIEYGLLSPVLIVFGVAIAGVLVEAFLSWRSRYAVQVAQVTLRSASRRPLRVTYKIDVAPGQYEVRVRRVSSWRGPKR